LDIEKIIADYKSLTEQYRKRSPDLNISNTLRELTHFAEKWSANEKSLHVNANVNLIGPDISSNDIEISGKVKQISDLRSKLTCGAFKCCSCTNKDEHLEKFLSKKWLEQCKERLSYETSSDNLLMSKEYIDRVKILRYLNYVGSENMVGLKGKVACEISNQELLITELMLENKFNRNPPEIASIISSMTCQYAKSKNRSSSFNTAEAGGGETIIRRISEKLLCELKREVLSVSERIDQAQRKYGIKTSISEELNFGLMEPVYHWASGMEFANIMKLTEAQEGLIVRCIQRLDEVCKDIRKAARVIGDTVLFEKMEETSKAIRRDIVFAESLYTNTGD